MLAEVRNDWDYTDMGKYIRLDRYNGGKTNLVISNAFYNKPVKLKSIDNSVIPNINTLKSFEILSEDEGNKVGLETTSLMYAFKGNCSIENIDLTGLNTSEITNMYGMFFDCCNLKRINLNGFDTGLVKDMRNMFANCTSLHSLDLSSFNICNVEYAENMFFNNISLQLLRMDEFNLKMLDISKIFTFFFELYKLPLLLVTNDRRIINYRGFAGYPFNRVPLSTPILDANGGKFEDGTSKKYYFDSVVNTTKKIQMSTFDKFKENNIPKKEGFTFIGWILVNREIPCPMNSTDMLNFRDAIYQAQWKKS